MKRLGVVVIFAVLVTSADPPIARVAAQNVSSEQFAGTPADKELIEIIDTLYQRYETHYAEAEKIGVTVHGFANRYR